MKYFTLSLFVVASLFIVGCASKKVKTTQKETKALRVKQLDLSKISFPSAIGDYKLQGKQALKSKAKGIMIRYLNKNKTTSYLDCNIHPKGKDTNFTAHYKDILSGISFMHKEGVLKKAKILKEDTIMIDATHSAQRTIFEMENKITPYYSVLYLAPLEDHYFYVRFSDPHKPAFLQSDFGEKTVKELFSKIKFNK